MSLFPDVCRGGRNRSGVQTEGDVVVPVGNGDARGVGELCLVVDLFGEE